MTPGARTRRKMTLYRSVGVLGLGFGGIVGLVGLVYLVSVVCLVTLLPCA